MMVKKQLDVTNVTTVLDVTNVTSVTSEFDCEVSCRALATYKHLCNTYSSEASLLFLFLDLPSVRLWSQRSLTFIFLHWSLSFVFFVYVGLFCICRSLLIYLTEDKNANDM